MENPFLLSPDEYVRSVNPIKDWAMQAAWYASRMLDKDYHQCLAHIQNKLKNNQTSLKDPNVVFFYRGENGDKTKQTAPLRAYLNNVIKNGHILAATGTVYLHPSVKVSHIVGYLDENVKLRSRYKKISQKYEAEGNKAMHSYYHNSQDNAKRDNNAVSGGFVAEGSIIQNTSAHSTLTSTTRSIASLSNACNERLIEGNRHYYAPEIILNNLASISTETNFEDVQKAVDLYQLTIPNVDQTMKCIQRSSDLYFRDTRKMNVIRDLVVKMKPLERAAVVYTGDLWHIRQLNQDFARRLITQLSMKGDSTHSEDMVAQIFKMDEQVVNYAHQINLSMMKGKGKRYEELSLDQQAILLNTCKNIVKTVDDYKPLIKAFFLTKNSPPTMASLPSMIRRSVVLSDTDSTMFAIDGWVKWYFGDLNFSDEGFAVAGAVMYMSSQSVAHILAQFSANMNVERSRLFTLAMKPEYVFPVFAQTSVAKHYYTAMAVKEGNVYEDIKMEIKGVHMKDSTVPKNIITAAADSMKDIIKTVMAGEKLSLNKIVNKTMDQEKMILDSLAKGETTYLKRLQIKPKSSYKEKEKPKLNHKGEAIDHTNYRHYTCWERCFARKYGHYEPPPYSSVTVPITLTSAKTTQAWLNGLEDREFAASFASWMEDHDIRVLTQLHIPIAHCQNYGIPEELKPILDSKRIVLALTRSFRNVVESHGFFSKTDMMFVEQFSNVHLV